MRSLVSHPKLSPKYILLLVPYNYFLGLQTNMTASLSNNEAPSVTGTSHENLAGFKGQYLGAFTILVGKILQKFNIELDAVTAIDDFRHIYSHVVVVGDNAVHLSDGRV